MHLIPTDTKIDFIGKRFITFGIAIFITISAVVGFLSKGLNYGIDFRGGYILEVKMPSDVDLSDLRSRLGKLDLGEVTLQQFGGPGELLIRFEEHKDGAIDKIKSTLGTQIDYRRVETVGPKVGEELIQNGVKAVAFALIAMLLYIAFRFEWQFAVCAILALFHDCFAILSLFCWFPLEFNETAIIAVLITAGYSINDTIVIFDRIRENIVRYKRMSRADVINKSVNETLSRTITTASTSLLALTALYFFGGSVISTFSVPILIGIIVGSFSSICLASPLLIYIDKSRSDVAHEDRPKEFMAS